MHKIYILRNINNTLYVGSSSDENKRVIKHNKGEEAEFTKRNKNFKLVYTESYSTLIEARRRERQIKGWRREKKENLIKFGKPNL